MPGLCSNSLGRASRGWLALVERRKAHLIELFETGRWAHYFTEQELLAELRAVNVARERFANVAGPERGEASPSIL
jgi:hypothetical protein